eukprot:XP_001708094.1 Hypothetical protein GL50803_31129 [Giardia lamblia ATCC 50803]
MPYLLGSATERLGVSMRAMISLATIQRSPLRSFAP